MSSKGNPHPFVYWAQNSSRVLLRVDLKDVKVNMVEMYCNHLQPFSNFHYCRYFGFVTFKDPDVQVNENHIKFMATGVGARGIELYDFELELSANIVPMVGKYVSVIIILIV